MWHGPARILGRDGQMYLLKHGGMYIRVHPCRLEHMEEVDTPSNENPSSVSSVRNTVNVIHSEDDSEEESDDHVVNSATHAFEEHPCREMMFRLLKDYMR